MTNDETHRAWTATRPAGVAIACSVSGTGPDPARVFGTPG
jgi:hypothetical protein